MDGSDTLSAAQQLLPTVSAGEGRSFLTQAVYQLVAVAVTFAVAILGGLITGERTK